MESNLLQSSLMGSAVDAARRLLGATLTHQLENGTILQGKIIETEAYDDTDVASHSFRGRTPRTEVLFGPAGQMYVYFTYGMHYCCNVVVGPEGQGAAVLIRAVEPLEGSNEMFINRGSTAAARGYNLTNGPAKVCQAFGIDKVYNGHDLSQEPVTLELATTELSGSEIVQTTRVGISQAKNLPWRFYIRGNPYVSKVVVA